MPQNGDNTKNLRHIAFIMDGNGRWAKKRGLPREAGHRAGVEVFRKIVRYCGDIGIPVVTVYAFSTENWKRPRHEVNLLMQLFYSYMVKCRDELMEEQVKFRVIGDRTPFSSKLLSKIEELEEYTSSNPRLLNIAVNYGGRAELVQAVERIIGSGRKNITEDDISAELYTAGIPEPDLIVRTSGEQRLSNFLIWQGAYSELYFTDTLWPDMTSADVDKAVEEFNHRCRRYGGLS